MSQFFVNEQASNLPPTVVETITGNDGIPEAAIAHNFNILTSGSTVKFTGSAATETLNFGISNLLLGSAGSISSGTSNVGVGFGSLSAVTSGLNNTAIGYGAGDDITTGTDNIAVGTGSLGSLTNGLTNIAIGFQSLAALPSGSLNICIGNIAGNSYTAGESSNIVIEASGVLGDTQTTRIGIQGGKTSCYIAGISGATAVGAPVAVNSSTGQLSSLGFGSTGQVLTSNGAGISATWQSTSIDTIPWTDEATSFNAAVGNGYFISSTATATLPASPSQGNLVAFIVDTASILTIQANTGQTIRLGNTVSASAGICVSTKRGDSIFFYYRASDTSWIAGAGAVGSWNIT